MIGDDQMLLDWEVAEGGKFRDVFGVGDTPLNFREVQFPVMVLLLGQDGSRLMIDVTADMVHEYLAHAKEEIQ